MKKPELDAIAKRYETWELGMLIHLHMRKAETSPDEPIRSRELLSAKTYHEVLGHKIKMLENV